MSFGLAACTSVQVSSLNYLAGGIERAGIGGLLCSVRSCVMLANVALAITVGVVVRCRPSVSHVHSGVQGFVRCHVFEKA